MTDFYYSITLYTIVMLLISVAYNVSRMRKIMEKKREEMRK